MASARKKQDEKNLKTLRELVSLPYNKYCFDCNQRGPTYVNVTIGSFVCTKCSGMLRGLTPPHRVKSISMATFTPEEVELVQSRGNDYCRRTWLGLYEGAPLAEARDEQQIHDLMIDKYERRRYYMDQPVPNVNSSHLRTVQNGSSSSNSITTATSSVGGGGAPVVRTRPQQQLQQNESLKHSPLRRLNNGVVVVLNGTSSSIDNNKMRNNNGTVISRPVVPPNVGKHQADFVANFDSADIFNAAINNNNGIVDSTKNVNNNHYNGLVITNGVHGSNGQASFANFDNNPVFTGANPFILPQPRPDRYPDKSEWTSFFDFDVDVVNNTDSNVQSMHNGYQKNTANVPPAPPEDRYAALKDLDNALKNQSALDWSGSNNSSVYSSPTPTSSMYNSSPPQSSYGSPSQGQFMSLFSQQETGSNSAPFNPFTATQLPWGGNSQTLGAPTAPTLVNGGGSNPNPFRATATAAQPQSDPFKVNGFAQNFQQPTTAFVPVNGSMWTAAPNPFKVTSNGHSNNPFL